MPSDELPAFGDDLLAADLAADTEINDQLLLSPSVDSIIDRSEGSGAYALRIIWGSLECDTTISELTDWTGSLSISRGAEIIRRVIRFEDGQDYIEPRTDRKLIEWVSFTSIHHDGIFVNLYIPPDDISSNTTDEAVTVTFETGPFTKTFELRELSGMDTIFHLDDSINSVSVRALQIYPSACPKGFLEGRWGRDSAGTGVFRGRWISQHGALSGFVRGFWGVDPDSNQANVFYGKWIDVTGRFKGFLKGEYGPRMCFGENGDSVYSPFPGGGWIHGRIFNANRNIIGALRGHYLMPKADEENRWGYFQARWKTYCGRQGFGFGAHDDID
jgi:hypothetical protein